MKPLPDSVKKLIEAKTYANVATLMPDGSPHVTQTWVDHDGDLVLINTFEGSQKHRNAIRNPKDCPRYLRPDKSLQHGRNSRERQRNNLRRSGGTHRQNGKEVPGAGKVSDAPARNETRSHQD